MFCVIVPIRAPKRLRGGSQGYMHVTEQPSRLTLAERDRPVSGRLIAREDFEAAAGYLADRFDCLPMTAETALERVLEIIGASVSD